MLCDELKIYSIDVDYEEKAIAVPDDEGTYMDASEVDEAIADLKAENQRLQRALWLMTAEWAKGMGLASCNIAIKLSFNEHFFYNDEANREKDIKKYRHRQVVFYRYADYCESKAEEYA
jgi:hypothetical protein